MLAHLELKDRIKALTPAQGEELAKKIAMRMSNQAGKIDTADVLSRLTALERKVNEIAQGSQ